MTKTDKRSRKTVHAIQTTLLRLLCGRKMREVRIVDLCTEADINRTTFYLHFAGLSDVLDGLRSEIVETIFARGINKVIDFDTPRNPLPFLTVCTDVLASCENFGDFVRLSSDADVFLTKLKNEFCEQLFRRYSDARGEETAGARHVFRFLIAGVLDCYTEWLKAGSKIPFEEVLGTCAPLVSAGQRLLMRAQRA